MFHLRHLFCFSTLVLNFLLLFFFLIFALQSGKKVASDPSPFVQFTVGHKSFESKVRQPSDPQRLNSVNLIYQQNVASGGQEPKSFGDFVKTRCVYRFFICSSIYPATADVSTDLTVLFLFFSSLSDQIQNQWTSLGGSSYFLNSQPQNPRAGGGGTEMSCPFF